MWWLGFFISISYVATALFYNAYIISVRCYFAALLSVIIYWILNGLPVITAFSSKNPAHRVQNILP